MAIQQELKTSFTHSAEAIRRELADILDHQRIVSVYQPIVSLTDGQILGYEALTRGPEQSVLHSPLPLFEEAEKAGLLYPLDRLARQKAIQNAFVGGGDQLIFINVSAHILKDPHFVPGRTLELLESRGLRPQQVVFEITERSSIEDFESAKKILEHYRSQGYRIAIDDAGAGYSSLQAIAELHPDFIKVDRSLVEGVHQKKIKEYILETLVTFAQKLDISLIAEGIETTEELVKLTRMGVHYGQGYLLGRPGKDMAVLPEGMQDMILRYRKQYDTAGSLWSIGDLSAPSQRFDRKTPISQVAQYFKDNLNALGAVIVSADVPVGLIMRDRLFQQLAGQYGFSLFWNRPIEQIMDAKPLIVDESTPVEHVSQLATSREISNLYDLVVITSKGLMKGTASIRSILECITNARMETAKVASPLTGLPGNMQIHRELNKRLTNRKMFSVIYADLDYFKWYNDRYGFHKGDQLIQFTADCLQQSIAVLGRPLDFIGHIGGDDFIIMSTTDSPEKLCEEIIRRFDQGVEIFYDSEEWSYVEDRSGNRIKSEGVTLSLSLVICRTSAAITAEQISKASARLKKQAKSQKGSIYYLTSIGSEPEDEDLYGSDNSDGS
ncbi:EAL and GGDEF domain-containing protein [Paenibacillus filicis]|uniref:EAL and GGDEF domain-containing protein n=1 Tax=Paenibacillus gyeongsangnamensis TaxID=3388067 RepID=A0ABT4Q4X2_9BACL|nr:bifunctional diguanylate cyclase/phosphodiesterase [Paenibacillus filicis]MCZ8511913.1 EAL and GGDEF domain-containing protein [Paenibacillus filicis]